MKLPNPAQTIELLEAKIEARETVDGMIKAYQELEEIMKVIQPLLYEISVFLYKDDDSEIALAKLVEDGVGYFKSLNEGAH
jgi:hypothetical protein